MIAVWRTDGSILMSLKLNMQKMEWNHVKWWWEVEEEEEADIFNLVVDIWFIIILLLISQHSFTVLTLDQMVPGFVFTIATEITDREREIKQRVMNQRRCKNEESYVVVIGGGGTYPCTVLTGCAVTSPFFNANAAFSNSALRSAIYIKMIKLWGRP